MMVKLAFINSLVLKFRKLANLSPKQPTTIEVKKAAEAESALEAKIEIKKGNFQKKDSEKIQIALIDDEQFIEEIVRLKLEDLKFDLTYYSNPQSFKDALQSGLTFDVVIVDRFCVKGFDAVRDKFAALIKKEFGFTGIFCLYSNLRHKDEADEGFDLVLHKSESLTPLIKYIQRN